MSKQFYSKVANSDFIRTTSLEEVARRCEPTTESTNCSEIYARFVDDSGLIAVAVARDNVPIGLVERSSFLVTLASPYGRALYTRKPISALMDKAPLIVEVSTDIRPLADLVLSSDSPYSMRAFIVTKGSSYFGIASGEDVLRLAVFEMQSQAKELIDAKHMAEAASRAKSQFLAAMSHELRTPLNVLLGFSQLIQTMPISDSFAPKAIEYATDIHASGSHLLSLINDVLDLAKIEAGKMSLELQELPLKDEIEAVVKRFTQHAEVAGIALVFAAAEQDVVCEADQRAFRQILENLVGNAIKFTSEGGTVTISLDLVEEDAVISIEDTGVGIEADDLKRLFVPFERTDNSYSRPVEGTGLGLSIARHLVKAHNGDLSATSEPGVGSCFTVILPARVGEEDLATVPAAIVTPQVDKTMTSKRA